MKTVLIVEDHLDTRIIYSSILRYAGYTVLEAVNGYEGVEQAWKSSPDLVLMDLSMPVLDGWDANRTLKSSTRTRAIPVVMVTAHGSEVNPDRVAAEGFVGLIAKPIAPTSLVKEVGRLIGPASSAAQESGSAEITSAM